MKSVEIYTTEFCGYCRMAKRLLDTRSIAFTEISLDREPERRGEMVARAKGRRTVPQIFIGGSHVGGCDDLYALERSGGLESLLAA
ncbi:MAG TPA: glutaredoxin 3 [Paracoccaceae bacterium]|nr:glutaredoxin 3 [Paracoccaceae bacterium]